MPTKLVSVPNSTMQQEAATGVALLTTGDFGHVLTEAAYLGIAAIVVAEN
jgi:hypothetical protein